MSDARMPDDIAQFWRGYACCARQWLKSARAAGDLDGEAEALEAIRKAEELKMKTLKFEGVW